MKKKIWILKKKKKRLKNKDSSMLYLFNILVIFI